MGYKGLQGVKGGFYGVYKRVIRGYKRLQVVRGGYKE